MNPKLYASLYRVIGEWADDSMGEDEWPDFYWADGLIERMVKVAAEFFDASVEGSQTAEKIIRDEAEE